VACRIAGVSRSCFYEFKYHVPSDRQIRRLLLSGLVADIHKRSRGTYGMLRIRAALMREQDMVVNKKLILSIMRELGIKGLPGPKKHKKNLVNEATEEDLVQRNFTVDRPNVLWLTTSPNTRPAKARSTAAPCLTPTAAGWSAGRSTGAVRPRSSTMRS
jgi:putative transposase